LLGDQNVNDGTVALAISDDDVLHQLIKRSKRNRFADVTLEDEAHLAGEILKIVPDSFDTRPTIGTNIAGAREQHDPEELVHEKLVIARASSDPFTGSMIDVKTT
jgi:hypothetical protein